MRSAGPAWRVLAFRCISQSAKPESKGGMAEGTVQIQESLITQNIPVRSSARS